MKYQPGNPSPKNPAKYPWPATGCLVVPVPASGPLPPVTQAADRAAGKAISKLLAAGDFRGKTGDTFLLPHLNLPHADRVLLVGCGKKQPLTPGCFQLMVTAAGKTLSQTGAQQAHFALTDLPVEGFDPLSLLRQAIIVLQASFYRFDLYCSEKKPPISLSTITFPLAGDTDQRAAKQAIREGVAIADAVVLTRDLGNQPPNVCTPAWLAEEALKLAKKIPGLSVKILKKPALKKHGMNALLAVGQGSHNEPCLIVLEYRGNTHKNQKKAPIVLVGKGITFDTGGLSLKPADIMVGMKYDMCGAATVLGTLKAAAELKLPLNLAGIIAAAENMPGGHAYRPEDILKSASGQTIEVLNTDAEGRLVLADALTHAATFRPDVVIDIATLTGAVVIALGSHASAVMGNHQALIDDLLTAGIQTHDRAWPLPLWEDYQAQIKSPFADMANVGGRTAGAITAACFLSRFAKKIHWAHLDVAGTAANMLAGSIRDATGRPVPLLVQYLINRSAAHAKS